MPKYITPDTAQHTSFPQAEDRTLSTVDEIDMKARRECTEKGLGEYCINDLKAIAFVETKFKCDAVGDFGSSHGCYQIHQGYHPEVTQEKAEDLDFAINWTLNRLIAYGYPEYRSRAIRKHNGSTDNPKTLVYLNKVNKF